MKAHELLNILNHIPPDAEWDGGDIIEITASDGMSGRTISISESVKTMPELSPPVEVTPQFGKF